MTNPSGIWPMPHLEDQFSHVRPAETNACTDYGTAHAIESQMKFYGDQTEVSERALAVMSHTDPGTGNNLPAVFNTVSNEGLIVDSLWPEPDTFTVADYYKPIDPAVLATASQWLKRWHVSEIRWNVPQTDLIQALQDAPIVVAVTLHQGGKEIGHIMAMIDKDNFLDSYPHHAGPTPNIWPVAEFLAPGHTIDSYNQIIIKPKTMNQAKVVKSKTSPTVYVCYPISSMPYLQEKSSLEGFVVPDQIPDTDSLT